MLYYLLSYLLGFSSGFVYNKHNINIKKEIDSILNLFLDKTNINKNEYNILNNYMDLINQKLDSVINSIYQKGPITQNVSDTIHENNKEK